MQFLGSLVNFNLALPQITKSQLDEHFPALSPDAQMIADGHRHPAGLQSYPGERAGSCAPPAHSPSTPDWGHIRTAGLAGSAQTQVEKWGKSGKWKKKKTPNTKNKKPIKKWRFPFLKQKTVNHMSSSGALPDSRMCVWGGKAGWKQRGSVVCISFPWSLTREIPGQSQNLTRHLFSLKAHAGGVLLFQNSLDMNRSPHREIVFGVILVSGPFSAIYLFSDFGQVHFSLTKCLWYWHRPHRVTLWNKGDVKCVSQQQRGLTAWRTGVSGDLLWATDRRHAGLVLTNFWALKTLTASMIYQEFILKKKTKKKTCHLLRKWSFPDFKYMYV